MSWQDEWEVVKPLGSGGQGNTRLVKRRSDELLGVVKTLRSEKKKDPQARRRMYRETAALKALSDTDACVPKVLGDNTDKYLDKSVELYFIMTYVPGDTLEEFIHTGGPMSLGIAISFVSDIGKTLHIGHQENTIHRDLKPKNIILAGPGIEGVAEGKPYLVDFGLSFNSIDADDDLTRTDERITNEFLSLPEGMASDSERRDLRSDVTALGGVLYYCLTGYKPGVLVHSDGAAPHRRGGHQISSASDDLLVVSQLNLLLDRAFSSDISKRFASCTELLTMLNSIARLANRDTRPSLSEVAESASEIMKATNKKTQHAALQQRAQKERENLVNVTTRFVGDLHLFRVDHKNSGVKHALPSEYLKATDPVQLRVSCPTAKLLAERHYQLATRGADLVVMVYDKKFNDSSRPKSGDWQELAVIGEGTNSVWEILFHDAQEWIAAQIQHMAQESASL